MVLDVVLQVFDVQDLLQVATGVVHMLGHSLGIEHDMTGWFIDEQVAESFIAELAQLLVVVLKCWQLYQLTFITVSLVSKGT